MVAFPEARLPAQSVAPVDHTHARAQPGSVGTDALVDNAVTFAKVDESGFPATTSAEVATAQSTSTTSFTDLSTAGPSVTMTPPASGKVKVHIHAGISNTGTAISTMGFALSGGNTLAAADARAICNDGTTIRRMGSTFLVSGLAAASTTFTAKYKTSAGANPAWFQERQIIVEPVLA